MSEPYTLDADLYPDISNIVTEDDTSKHNFPSDIDLSPDISHIITEDDTPVDNFASEKLQRLLVESLYNSWTVPSDFQTFLAAANVALFYAVKNPPLVPDVFLSLDVTVAEDWWQRRNRSYLFWEFGKPPEVVIEIVSNTEGGELNKKLREYARMRVLYYIVFDPIQQLKQSVLQVFELQGTSYVPMTEYWLEGVGLGLTLWQGVFEGRQDVWLRWCDREGNVIPTGTERAEQERQRAEQERQRAEQEHQRAEQAESQLEQERQRAERLVERLRTLGINPD